MSLLFPRSGDARFAIAAAVIVASVTGAAWASAPLVPPVPSVASDTSRATALARLEGDLRFWRSKLDADPTSALVLGELAALHARRARETGRTSDWLETERLSRAALGERTRRNGAAAATLVSALLAQHRFADAFAEADALVRREPEVVPYRAVLGEAAMECGRYDVARAMFATVWSARADRSVAPRLARWLELQGHVPTARRILTGVTRDALRRSDVEADVKAWFALRLGELEMRAGRHVAARDAFVAGLGVAPDDIRLHTAMARLAATGGEWGRAIEWGESAVALRLDPEPLIVLAEAHAALGDTSGAREYEATLQLVATPLDTATASPPHRSWSLYRLDHALDVADVLQEAERDLRIRTDVYGYDLAAWALHKSGRSREARAMMHEALALGTTDPLLARHAAAIGMGAPVAAPESDKEE